MGESTCSRVTLQFDRRLRLEFRGATIASDAGLLACRELDYALELTETATTRLQESRGGRNVQNQYPFYANLGAFEPDGDVFCSGVPLTGPVNSAISRGSSGPFKLATSPSGIIRLAASLAYQFSSMAIPSWTHPSHPHGLGDHNSWAGQNPYH